MSRAIAALFAAGVILVSHVAHAQEVEFLTTRFERYAEALRHQTGVPGMSAAIVQNGNIVWERGFGEQDVENHLPATADTPYYLGDLTQAFTATLVLQCVEQGLVSLDTLVPVTSGAAGPTLARVDDLLRHTRRDVAGSVFEYNPARFAALTGVVERCAHESYRLRLTHAILDRLGMNRSLPGIEVATTQPFEFQPERMAIFSALRSQMAIPYRVDGKGRATPSTFPSDPLNGAIGLVSTVRDLARFDSALDSLALLRAEMIAAAWAPRPAVAGHPQPFGLGWFAQVHNGQPVVWHFAYTPNAGSALVLKLPQKGTTLILLANSDGLSATFPLQAGDVTVSPLARVFLTLFN
jgi:CubicO group peptidase (beta-lactamase class C family)